MKKILALVLALIMVLALGSFATAEEEKTLTVWFSCWTCQGEDEKAQEDWKITQIVKQFEEAHPGVTVNMMHQADEQLAMSKLRASVMAGDAPDIINMYSFYPVANLVDCFLDITDMIPAEDMEGLSGWSAVEVDGRYYGYPVNRNEACVCMYNKDIAAAAGIDLEGENAPKNAQEFWDVMQKIKDSGNGVFIENDGNCNGLFVFWFSSFWSQISGVSTITSDSLAQTKFAEDEGFLKSLQYAADCFAAGFVNKDYATCKDASTRFIAGEGCFKLGTSINTTIKEAMGDKLGIFMIPDFDETVANPGMQIGGAGQAACVLKSSKNPELAIEFLSYVSNFENTVELMQGGIALRKDCDAAAMGYTGDPIFERYYELISQHDFAWNDNALQGDVANEFYKLSSQAVIGAMTVEECAKALDQLAEDVADNA